MTYAASGNCCCDCKAYAFNWSIDPIVPDSRSKGEPMKVTVKTSLNRTSFANLFKTRRIIQGILRNWVMGMIIAILVHVSYGPPLRIIKQEAGRTITPFLIAKQVLDEVPKIEPRRIHKVHRIIFRVRVTIQRLRIAEVIAATVGIRLREPRRRSGIPP